MVKENRKSMNISEDVHQDFKLVKVEMQHLLGVDLNADIVLQNLIKTYRVCGKAQLKTILKEA